MSHGREEPRRLVCTKNTCQYVAAPSRIKSIRFGIASAAELSNAAEVEVYQRPLYSPEDRQPYSDGLLDKRMGVSKRKDVCLTCQQPLDTCSGHFGSITLSLPVFNIGYFKDTWKVLQCVCKTCSSVLLPREEREKALRNVRGARNDGVRRQAIFISLHKKCKTIKQCPACGDYNGPVKKVTDALKLVHFKYPASADDRRIMEEFSDVIKRAPEVEPFIAKAGDDLNPLRAQNILAAIDAVDCELLDLGGRPEDFLMTVIPVPPVCIRPSVEVDGGGGSQEDDITMSLTKVLDANNSLRDALQQGLLEGSVMELWDYLQTMCAGFIDSNLPGMGKKVDPQSKPLRGLVQRLKGKQGRFRGNLSGKRVEYTGRTVISPDPNLRIDQVGIPRQMAMTLTYPERVTDHNKQRLQHCIVNGATAWPGANMVISGANRVLLKWGDRVKIANELKVGDIVERHLRDGDVVLFNRQPSLHRMSIMAHSARVMPWRTLRFNECVCNPYNADFDGDEMNLHLPQTEEARAEAKHLMGVVDNLCTPKNGEILIAATQDFLTSAYLLTSKDKFYTRRQMCQFCAYMSDAAEHVQLPQPSVLKPEALWTGKQLFSMLIRPNAAARLFVNLETKEKIYERNEYMCPYDGYVCFHNSYLISGRLGKATLGGGNKAGLFQVLATDYSPRAAAAVMNRLAKLSARFIGEHGFSIGIDDVTPALELQTKKQATIQESYAECDNLIDQFKANKLTLTSGCDMEGSLEAQVTGVLNNIRESASKVCMNTLHRHNSPLIMSQCGSKGSPINIAQMVACVGQQVVSGSRAPNGFKDRSLPHYPRGDKAPSAKGFVANSFYSGLTPTEFFFHTMAGREGLVDTAVKTAETGYMSRRLIKALEDLRTMYDGTVRSAADTIVQFQYGEDGMDPVCMEGKDGEPIALERCMSLVKAHYPIAARDVERQLPRSLKAAVKEKLGDMIKCKASSGVDEFCAKAFLEGLEAFLFLKVKEYLELRRSLGLPEDMFGEDATAEAASAMLAPKLDHLHRFIKLCTERYDIKRMDPGSTVGAVAAQSIGEPGTQMTLKTFHFAGVAAMNVTLGVPRIREIINASKKISTPIITVSLEVADSEFSARLVKGRLENTTVGHIAAKIERVLSPQEAYISIILDRKRISNLQLDVSEHSVANAVQIASRKILRAKNVDVRIGFDEVQVHPAPENPSLLFDLLDLMQKLPAVPVQGIPTIERAIVNKTKKGYQLLVEGTDLRSVMGTVGVIGTKTTTNHVLETAACLGIEAARSTIIKEIQFTMGSHGMSIDSRHTMLLADCMTFKGEVLGITRFGISKMKESVLNLASFEKTTDVLFDAAIHGRVDEITGVSESIILGMPMPAGTGMFQLIRTE